MYRDDFATPDVARENYEAIEAERDEMERDRYTVAELKELEMEHKLETAREVMEGQRETNEKLQAEYEARLEADEERMRDLANDMKI